MRQPGTPDVSEYRVHRFSESGQNITVENGSLPFAGLSGKINVLSRKLDIDNRTVLEDGRTRIEATETLKVKSESENGPGVEFFIITVYRADMKKSSGMWIVDKEEIIEGPTVKYPDELPPGQK